MNISLVWYLYFVGSYVLIFVLYLFVIIVTYLLRIVIIMQFNYQKQGSKFYKTYHNKYEVQKRKENLKLI